MTLTFIGNNTKPAYLALSSDIVDNSIVGATQIGKTIYLTDTNEWKIILSDLTLAEYTPGQGGEEGATTFIELTDVPASYASQAGKIVAVKGAENGLEFIVVSPGVDEFTQLTDAPASYAGQSGKVPAVKGAEDGLEFVTLSPGVEEFTELVDVPASYTGQSGKVPAVNGAEDALEFIALSPGVNEFTELSDVPSSYTGQSGKVPVVNGGATALEFATVTGDSDQLVQKVGNVVSSTTLGTVTIPYDDSIPQSGEGAEFLTQTITPINVNNILYIKVRLFGAVTQNSGVYLIVALFKDSDANALAAVATYIETGSSPSTMSLTYKMTAGSTSAITFKVRAGAHAGNYMMNGSEATGRRYGGVACSSITIEEIIP